MLGAQETAATAKEKEFGQKENLDIRRAQLAKRLQRKNSNASHTNLEQGRLVSSNTVRQICSFCEMGAKRRLSVG